MPRVRLDGGVIGVTNNPTGSSATGMWSMKEHEKFTRSSLWPAASPLTNTAGIVNAQLLIVAGGGGGSGGGGGAGGLVYNNLTNLSNTSYVVTIGAGGAATVAGTNTTFVGTGSNITAQGGGAASGGSARCLQAATLGFLGS